MESNYKAASSIFAAMIAENNSDKANNRILIHDQLTRYKYLNPASFAEIMKKLML